MSQNLVNQVSNEAKPLQTFIMQIVIYNLFYFYNRVMNKDLRIPDKKMLIIYSIKLAVNYSIKDLKSSYLFTRFVSLSNIN